MCDYGKPLFDEMNASLSTFIKASSWIHNTDKNMSCIALNISLIKMITYIINSHDWTLHNTYRNMIKNDFGTNTVWNVDGGTNRQ